MGDHPAIFASHTSPGAISLSYRGAIDIVSPPMTTTTPFHALPAITPAAEARFRPLRTERRRVKNVKLRAAAEHGGRLA